MTKRVGGPHGVERSTVGAPLACVRQAREARGLRHFRGALQVGHRLQVGPRQQQRWAYTDVQTRAECGNARALVCGSGVALGQGAHVQIIGDSVMYGARETGRGTTAAPLDIVEFTGPRDSGTR